MRGNALKDTTTINSMYNVKQNSDKEVVIDLVTT